MNKNSAEQIAYTTTTSHFFDKMKRWSQANQLWPFSIGTMCCGQEYGAAHQTQYGLKELGHPQQQNDPEKSDLMIIVGTVTYNLLPYLLENYNKMNSQKWVIAVGACAINGGLYTTYNVIQDINQYIPVDIYIPGCPPAPEAFISATKLIKKQIQEGICAATIQSDTPS